MQAGREKDIIDRVASRTLGGHTACASLPQGAHRHYTQATLMHGGGMRGVVRARVEMN